MTTLNITSKKARLQKIDVKKIKKLRITTSNVQALQLTIESTSNFWYVGSIMTVNGGASIDINASWPLTSAYFTRQTKL